MYVRSTHAECMSLSYNSSVCTSIRTLGKSVLFLSLKLFSLCRSSSFYFYFISLLFIHFWFAAFSPLFFSLSLFSSICSLQKSCFSCQLSTLFQYLCLSSSLSICLVHFSFDVSSFGLVHDVFITWKTLNYAFLPHSEQELYIEIKFILLVCGPCMWVYVLFEPMLSFFILCLPL